MVGKIKAAAMQLAVLIFFVMAAASWFTGCSPAVCAWRAFGGAVVMYAVVSIAGRLIMKILIDAMVDSQVRKQADGNKE